MWRYHNFHILFVTSNSWAEANKILNADTLIYVPGVLHNIFMAALFVTKKKKNETWTNRSINLMALMRINSEKAKATHTSILAWKIPWTEEPSRLESMGSWRVGHDWATSLSLFTFMHWRRKWQPTPVFLPGESQGRGSLVGCRLWGRTESTEATWRRQQWELIRSIRRNSSPWAKLGQCMFMYDP